MKGYRIQVFLLLIPLLGGLAGCQRIQEPWVNNAEDWKEQAFQTDADNDRLDHRLKHTQVDR